MTNQTDRKIARILYKEIVEGDLLKLEAKSNKANTGGGARDFRFGSYSALLPIIKQMFPQTVKEGRNRDRKNVMIDVFKGFFSWEDSLGNVQRKEVYFEPPTDARPSEGRIVRVHEYPCLDTSNVKIGEDNRVLLLLIQLYDGSIWPRYAEEISLRKPGIWDPVVAKELLRCLDAVRRANQVAIGYLDFTNGDRYCNGK